MHFMLQMLRFFGDSDICEDSPHPAYDIQGEHLGDNITQYCDRKSE